MSAGAFETTVFCCDEEVERLVRDFKSGVLPRERWTHHAHLVVALWHVDRYNWEIAVRLVRTGIKHYNACHHIANTPTGGYHETITLFWLRMVRDFDDRTGTSARTLAALANELLLRLGDKNLPLKYYSRERLMSAEARANWMSPDLKQFPSNSVLF